MQYEQTASSLAAVSGAETNLGIQDSFWERGRVAPAPAFGEQIRELRSGEMERPQLIYANSRSIIGDQVSQPVMSEGQAMLELDDFVNKLGAVDATTAASAGFSDQDDVRNWASKFSGDFTLLASKEYQEAVQGIASAWAGYLGKSPTHFLNIFDRQKEIKKSNNKVLEDIIGAFNEIPESSELGKQLLTDSETWRASDNARYVVVDDYVATGADASEALGHMRTRVANRRPDLVTNFIDRAEVHLLMAADTQTSLEIESGIPDVHLSAPVRAYYATRTSGNFDLNPSSFYSSMDYGFSERLNSYGQSLRTAGVQVSDPLLAHIDKPYAPDPLVHDAEGSALLQMGWDL